MCPDAPATRGERQVLVHAHTHFRQLRPAANHRNAVGGNAWIALAEQPDDFISREVIRGIECLQLRWDFHRAQGFVGNLQVAHGAQATASAVLGPFMRHQLAGGKQGQALLLLRRRQRHLRRTGLRPAAPGVLRPEAMEHKAVAFAGTLRILLVSQAERRRPGQRQQIVIEHSGHGLRPCIAGFAGIGRAHGTQCQYDQHDNGKALFH
ncbi:hypothetical protein D3C84_880390 [compost metagenome]